MNSKNFLDFIIFLSVIVISTCLDEKLMNRLLMCEEEKLKHLKLPEQCEKCHNYVNKDLLECSFEMECDSNYCNNKGVCLIYRYTSPNSSVAVCICDPGSIGITCDDMLYSCPLTKPCNNVTECIRELGLWICLCPVGYSGELCRVPLKNWIQLTDVHLKIERRSEPQTNSTTSDGLKIFKRTVHNLLTFLLVILLVAIIIALPFIFYFYIYKPKKNIVEFFKRNENENENLIRRK